MRNNLEVGKMKEIMVVDDEESVRITLSLVLEKEGYKISIRELMVGDISEMIYTNDECLF